MALNKVKGLLSSAMAVATVLSTIPAVNVAAAETPAPVIDVVSQYELDLLKYGTDYLRNTIPGFENMSPAQFEEVKDLFIDGNYTQYDILSKFAYKADGSLDYSYEYEYDAASGRTSKITYKSTSYSSVTVNEYGSDDKVIKNYNYSIDGRYLGYSTHEYGADGKETKVVNYDYNGVESGYTEYVNVYWDNGKLKDYWFHNYLVQNGEYVEMYAGHSENDEAGNQILYINYSYDWANRKLKETDRTESIYTQNEWGISVCERTNHYTEGVFDYSITAASNYTVDDSLESITYYWNPDSSPKSSSKMIFKKINGSSTYYATDYIEYDASGNITSHRVTERDLNTPINIIKETTYDGNGSITSWADYRYVSNEYFDNSHYVPNFDAYSCDENCVFNYRLYNPNSGEHFYTGSREEALHITELGWNFEGPGFVNPTTGDAVYRLYNESKGDHLYTMDVDEISSLIEGGEWKFDDGDDGTHWVPAFPSADTSTGSPMYRLYNPNAWDSGKAGAFHFTMSEEERDHLVSIGWDSQGIGWYSV